MATDWGVYNLPAIWQMLREENLCTGADRVLAWDGLATSVREQRRRLLKAGEDLAEAWPPEKNASAVVFLNRIGDLAESMSETLACAEDTRVGLRGVIETLGEAQSTIRTLAEGRAAVSDDWIPRFIDHAEDEYDEKAQQVMRAAEAAVADHSTQIRAPQLYGMLSDHTESRTPFSGEVRSVQAMPVPVAVPNDPVLPGTDSGPGNGRRPETDQSLGVGPGLSGVTAPAAVSPPASGVVLGQPSGPAAGGGGIGLGPVAGASGLGGFSVPSGRAGPATGRRTASPRRALPPGAVIGPGIPGSGRGGAGRTPLGVPGNRLGRRENGLDSPVGGKADEQWETLVGVAPVIAPDTRPVRHDPGPGVIGIDR